MTGSGPAVPSTTDAGDAPDGPLERLLGGAARPLLPDFPKLGPDEDARVLGDLRRFLAHQIARAPRYLRTPVQIALWGFELLPLLRYGRRYTALDPEVQGRILSSWARSRIGPKRDLIMLIRSSALYFYLDHEVVREALEEQSQLGAGDPGEEGGGAP